jgi:hypothetical protein
VPGVGIGVEIGFGPGNDRLQVFRKDGTFVREVVIAKDTFGSGSNEGKRVQKFTCLGLGAPSIAP